MMPPEYVQERAAEIHRVEHRWDRVIDVALDLARAALAPFVGNHFSMPADRWTQLAYRKEIKRRPDVRRFHWWGGRH